MAIGAVFGALIIAGAIFVVLKSMIREQLGDRSRGKTE